MTAKLEQAFIALGSLPSDRQDELADVLFGVATPAIQYSEEQLEQLDEAIAAADRGEFASTSDVAAVFEKLRNV